MNNEIVFKLATLVRQNGGETYYVGGCVRDHFLGIESKDIDLEVHGINELLLKDILSQVGKKIEYGKSFGIYAIAGENIEIALPRKEVSTGEGHKDFDIEIDPFIGTKKAAKRRDFTINSIMINAISNELVDHYGGVNDIQNRIIRHIDDDSFVEDPLRVFRAARFASKLNFIVHEKTIELCKTMNTKSLSKERVEAELKRVLTESNKPSLFFEVLNSMNQLDYWFDEVKKTIGYKQNPKKHPEGDVFEHTMLSLDAATIYRDLASNSYNFMLLVLVHDFGKLRTKVMTSDGIHFYGHEKMLRDIQVFLERLVSSKETKKYVLEMVPKHMRGHQIYKKKLDEYESSKWFDSVSNPKDLIYFTIADKANHPDYDRQTFFILRYNIYKSLVDKLLITGQDLIDMGLNPSEDFSEYLDFARELTLKGTSKEDALTIMKNYIKDYDKYIKSDLENEE